MAHERLEGFRLDARGVGKILRDYGNFIGRRASDDNGGRPRPVPTRRTIPTTTPDSDYEVPVTLAIRTPAPIVQLPRPSRGR